MLVGFNRKGVAAVGTRYGAFDKLGGAKARRSDVQDCPVPQGSRSTGGMPAVVMEGGIDLAGALTLHGSDDDLPPGDRKGLEGRVRRVSQQ